MYTDFAGQQPKQRLAWGHETYRQFRDNFFFDGWLGKGQGAIVEHITELSQNDKGETGAMLRLVADLYGGGAVGDNTLRGRERKLDSAWQMVTYDQMRNAVVTKGELNEQKSVIKTRDEASDVLGRWLANSTEDQLILCASGISFAYEIDGSPRVAPAGQDNWTSLDYAQNVRPPSTYRYVRWDSATGTFLPGDTTQIKAADTPVYKMLPQLWALARRRRIKPIRVGKKDYLVLLTPPETISAFYQDPDFRQVIVQGGVRGTDNPIFENATVTMHGFVIQEYNKVFTTLGATSGVGKWGAGNAIDGARSLLLGSQALAFADLKVPMWREEEDDYQNVKGIACRKWMGVLQPRFPDPFTGTVEDFNRICIDHAI
jgi:hypothetical protein